MTSPEHTLVGIHLALACGVHRYVGWRGVAMAGIASNVPDWDGFPMLFDMQRFEAGHRVWGHNVWAVIVGAIVLAATQRRWDWIGWLGRRITGILPLKNQPNLREQVRRADSTGLAVWLAIAGIAQAVHLPCDLVVSGGEGLTHWMIRPWWPLANTGYVLPLIPWGDIGPTVILMAGIIAVAAVPRRVSLLSAATLVVLVIYLVVRGWVRGVIAF